MSLWLPETDRVGLDGQHAQAVHLGAVESAHLTATTGRDYAEHEPVVLLALAVVAAVVFADYIADEGQLALIHERIRVRPATPPHARPTRPHPRQQESSHATQTPHPPDHPLPPPTALQTRPTEIPPTAVALPLLSRLVTASRTTSHPQPVETTTTNITDLVARDEVEVGE